MILNKPSYEFVLKEAIIDSYTALKINFIILIQHNRVHYTKNLSNSFHDPFLNSTQIVLTL